MQQNAPPSLLDRNTGQRVAVGQYALQNFELPKTLKEAVQDTLDVLNLIVGYLIQARHIIQFVFNLKHENFKISD